MPRSVVVLFVLLIFLGCSEQHDIIERVSDRYSWHIIQRVATDDSTGSYRASFAAWHGVWRWEAEATFGSIDSARAFIDRSERHAQAEYAKLIHPRRNRSGEQVNSKN